MAAQVPLRELTSEEPQAIATLAQARTAPRAGSNTPGSSRRPSAGKRPGPALQPGVLAAHRLPRDPSLPRAGPPRLGRTAPGGAAADRHRRAAGRRPRHGRDRPPAPGPALWLLDPRSLVNRPQRADGAPEQAESQRRAPPGGRAPREEASDRVRRAGRPCVRRTPGVTKSAADRNRIAPWWKVLRSRALNGRRFETWEAVGRAVAAATASGNQPHHPFGWGRRWRQGLRRQPGIAAIPGVKRLAG
jgi:hypothetical protein